MKGMKLMFVILLVTMAIAFAWNSMPFIKQVVHFLLDPTAGKLLDFNITWGMILIVLVITFITTLAQKYGTDQSELKKIKEEQKVLQEEMKKYKDHPDKVLELNKKQLEFLPRTMDLTTRPLLYTAIPFVLFFRWFGDYFSSMENFRFFGLLSWFWFYFIATIIFSTILRKVLKVY
ncbi:MAG: EMC3/TMCO1 family protein [Candidatus Nanoarchaeia archaeon]|nr:EMC3/TMCO1 family protein [Candidatus Nanoarchaeia archaeon]MDD5741739.1 EMC3/TMCO1 family protein [Candidatus Nanoarchaeia archaeon]